MKKTSAHCLDRMLFSAREVARLTGFGKTVIYQAIKAGEIRHTLVRGKIRVKAEDLHRWIDGASRRR